MSILVRYGCPLFGIFLAIFKHCVSAIELKIDTWWNARNLRSSFSKICWPDFQAQLLKNYTPTHVTLTNSQTDTHCGKIQLFCSKINFHFHLQNSFPSRKIKFRIRGNLFQIYFFWQKKHTVRNLHFLSKNSTLISKLSIFWGKKLVKMLWFWTFQLLTTLISREKLSKKIGVKNSWKCWGFVKIEFLDKNLTFRIVWKWDFAKVCITERLCHSTPLQHQHNFAPVEQEEHQTSAPMKLLKKKSFVCRSAHC